MAKINSKPELTDEEIEQTLFDAMRIRGMLPVSIEEFAALDVELASLELPFGPTGLDELFKRLDAANLPPSTTILPNMSADHLRGGNLAHAAREGSELTQEIEQRMSADKSIFLKSENDARQSR